MTPRGKLQLLKDEGLIQFIQLARDAQQAKKDRTLIERTLDPSVIGSSISDDGIYPGFCLLASQDQEVFKRFRRSLIYRPVLEHVTREQGSAYLHELEQGGRSPEEFRSLIDTDSVGRPIKYDYPTYGRVSPTTLRYLKVASDLADRFGPLDDMRMAEIGVGYGGQCRVLCSMWNIKAYSLFDLPEALALSQRFLRASGVDLSVVSAQDGRAPEEGNFDLVVSNYAFSELRGDVQELYFERVIRNSPKGYMTYNHTSPQEFHSLTAAEFAERVPGGQILPENPKTAEGNVIVAWGG